ncbi:MAG: nucleotidyltransferase domain-containing protein [Chloroflexota bacterium]
MPQHDSTWLANMTEPGLDARVFQEVCSRLEQVEREEDVVVCLAVESGSRAWGFASADSDYDVRFIFVRRPEEYLSVRAERRRDVIERPILDEIDLSGWDLRKALRLYLKSNPPLLEWLQCPLVYRERFAVAERMRALLPVQFSPRASFYFFLHSMPPHGARQLPGVPAWRCGVAEEVPVRAAADPGDALD